VEEASFAEGVEKEVEGGRGGAALRANVTFFGAELRNPSRDLHPPEENTRVSLFV
jgi:hypothetical protein